MEQMKQEVAKAYLSDYIILQVIWLIKKWRNG